MKLTKKPPPSLRLYAQDATASSSELIDNSVSSRPYESIPKSDNPPRFVTSPSLLQTDVSPVVPISNLSQPFSDTENPFSPVSDTDNLFSEETPVVEHASYQPIPARHPGRLATTGEAASSADMRTSSNVGADPVRQVKVARDMYDGQNPPEYTRSSSPKLRNGTQQVGGQECRSCGRKMVLIGEGGYNRAECTKCGKRSVAAFPTEQLAPLAHIRSISETFAQSNNRGSVASSSTAVTQPRRPCCRKCGRDKRPMTTPLPQSTERPGQIAAPTTAPVPQNPFTEPTNRSSSTGSSPEQISVSRPRLAPKSHSSGLNIRIPSTSSDRTLISPANTPPSINNTAPKKEFKRGTSFSSTISRTFSRRQVSNPEGKLPSPRLSQDHNTPLNLINMINNAIRSNESPDYTALSKNGAAAQPSNSRFSFDNRRREDEAFEMSDMRRPGTVKGPPPSSWRGRHITSKSLAAPMIVEIPSTPTDGDSARPEISRSKSEATPRTRTAGQDDVFLADPNQRPQLTRFKSLRAGVERAASVTRSASLKRLDSVKNVPQFWYRTDMALEGVY